VGESFQSQMEGHQYHLEVEVEVGENHPHFQVVCMDCIWVLEQLLVQTSWVAVG
jgi:hypothetical protein